VEKINLEIASIAVDQENVKLLMTLPGIDYYAAMVIASEIGDVTRFPDAKNLVSWTGLARLRSLLERVARRRGENKAIVAVAREMLVIAYHMLKRKEPYRGVNDELYRSKLKRLERLGNSSLA